MTDGDLDRIMATADAVGRDFALSRQRELTTDEHTLVVLVLSAVRGMMLGEQARKLDAT